MRLDLPAPGVEKPLDRFLQIACASGGQPQPAGGDQPVVMVVGERDQLRSAFQGWGSGFAAGAIVRRKAVSWTAATEWS